LSFEPSHIQNVPASGVFSNASDVKTRQEFIEGSVFTEGQYANDNINTTTTSCWLLPVILRGGGFTRHRSQSLNETICISECLIENKNVDLCKIPGITTWTRLLHHRYLLMNRSQGLPINPDEVLQNKGNIKCRTSIGGGGGGGGGGGASPH
jgi:hypothetical protein